MTSVRSSRRWDVSARSRDGVSTTKRVADLSPVAEAIDTAAGADEHSVAEKEGAQKRRSVMRNLSLEIWEQAKLLFAKYWMERW
jgi:hypothetical protein